MWVFFKIEKSLSAWTQIKIFSTPAPPFHSEWNIDLNIQGSSSEYFIIWFLVLSCIQEILVKINWKKKQYHGKGTLTYVYLLHYMLK